MVLIAGNNIASIFLSAYCEKEKIEYRRFYTSDISDYTFYFNDSKQGMQAKAIKELGLEDEFIDEEGDYDFRVRLDENAYKICDEHDVFLNKINISEHEKNFEKLILCVGKEWEEVVNNDFDVKMTMNSIMARNFTKGFKDTLYGMVEDSNVRKVFMSMVPKQDISFNTAAGYIVNQVFDRCVHKNLLPILVEKMYAMCNLENHIKISDFDLLKVNCEEKNVCFKDDKFSFDTYVKLFDKQNPETKLTTFYVEGVEENVGYEFIVLDGMYEKGIEQMILWKGTQGYQLDVYYSVEDENEITDYVRKHLNELKIKKQIAYENLKSQYGTGSFAGWAFNVKENARNPIVCRDNTVLDLSLWGNAHFTSSLLAKKYITKNRKK